MRAIVTITPPTPNGDLHLGHLSGPFLAADVCTRTLRQAGVETLLLSYSDDYQSYLLRKGRIDNIDPYELAERNTRDIEASMRMAKVDVDHFMHAHSSPAYLEAVQHYLNVLDRQDLVERTATYVHRCNTCNVWGYEGFGRGECNHCGAPSDASQCEACARAPVASEMTGVTCMLCKGSMEGQSVERLQWRLGSSFGRLRALYENDESLRPHLREYLQTVLANDADTWAISRPGEDAIPVGSHPDEPIHTWFAGLAGYKAALREHLDNTQRGDQFDSWWSADTKLFHFLGFDCSYSHVVGYRALLEADRDGPKDARYFSNRFLTLDGEDFSTSRNHAIWIRDITRDFQPEAVRLYTATTSPEHKKADFNRHDFEAWYRDVFLPTFMAATWESANDENYDESVAFFQHHLAPIVQGWHQASSLNGFSMRGIGEASNALLLALARNPAPAQASALWASFVHVAAAVCPNLANIAELSLQTNAPRLAAWVAKTLGGRV